MSATAGSSRETRRSGSPAETWLVRDICDHDPLPFDDDSFDFVICSQTLEDIRDPIWVCREISRIGRAGYIEVPSRLEEQSWGVAGEYVGWSHHRWMIDAVDGGLSFVPKPHSLHGMPQCYFPREFWLGLSEEEKNLEFEWEGSFTADERIFFEQPGETLEEYLRGLVEREKEARGFVDPATPLHRRVRERASRALQQRPGG